MINAAAGGYWALDVWFVIALLIIIFWWMPALNRNLREWTDALWKNDHTKKEVLDRSDRRLNWQLLFVLVVLAVVLHLINRSF
jgi:hypothetical protein